MNVAGSLKHQLTINPVCVALQLTNVTDSLQAPESSENGKTIKSTLRSRFSLDDLLMDKEKSTVSILYELHHEKTGFLPRRKQRRRPASREPRS